jgi:Na+/melibiose symporter-like transporter
MYAAVLPVSCSYYLLWNPPALETEALFLYLTGVAVCVRTFITLFEVPSTAMAPELTSDYDERTELASIRYFFGWAGGITVAVIAYSFLLVPTDAYPDGQLNPEGYEAYGAVAAVMMAGAMLLSSLGTHRQIPHLRKPPPRRQPSPRVALRELQQTLSNRSFLALFGFGVFTAMASGLVASMAIYFQTYFWDLRADQIALLVPSGFISAIIAVTLTPRVAARFGKRPAAIGISIAAALLAPVPIVLRLLGAFPENGTAPLLACLIAHNIVEIALIIMSSTLVSAMMADIVEQSELQTGRRSEGTFYAARSFIQKSLTGMGIVSATFLLRAVGFPENAGASGVDSEVLVQLGLWYAPLLTLFYLVAIMFLFGYRINRLNHEENLRRLTEQDD